MAMMPQDWTLGGLATELRRDKRWLAKLIADAGLEPVKEKGRVKYWRMADVVKAIMGRDQALDLTAERARLAANQAKKLELEIAQIEGSLVPIETAKEALEKQVVAAKGKLLSMASRLSQRIASITGGDLLEIEQLITDEVHDVLKEMAGADASAGDSAKRKPARRRRKSVGRSRKSMASAAGSDD